MFGKMVVVLVASSLNVMSSELFQEAEKFHEKALLFFITNVKKDDSLLKIAKAIEVLESGAKLIYDSAKEGEEAFVLYREAEGLYKKAAGKLIEEAKSLEEGGNLEKAAANIGLAVDATQYAAEVKQAIASYISDTKASLELIGEVVELRKSAIDLSLKEAELLKKWGELLGSAMALKRAAFIARDAAEAAQNGKMEEGIIFDLFKKKVELYAQAADFFAEEGLYDKEVEMEKAAKEIENTAFECNNNEVFFGTAIVFYKKAASLYVKRAEFHKKIAEMYKKDGKEKFREEEIRNEALDNLYAALAMKNCADLTKDDKEVARLLKEAEKLHSASYKLFLE